MSAIDEMYQKYGATFKVPSPMMFRLNGCTLETYYESMFTEGYKPFTAEKQISIIQFLGKSADFHYTNDNFSVLGDYDTIEVDSTNFAEGLAELMTKFYDELAPAQKQEVKEILER